MTTIVCLFLPKGHSVRIIPETEETIAESNPHHVDILI